MNTEKEQFSQSMTGYANYKQSFSLADFISEADSQTMTIEIDIQSINSRYLEIFWRSDENLRRFENIARTALKSQLERGRLSVSCTLYIQAESIVESQLNTAQKLARFDQKIDDALNWQSHILQKVHGAKTMSVYEITRLLGVDFNDNKHNKKPDELNQLNKLLQSSTWQVFIDKHANDFFSRFFNGVAQELKKSRQIEAQNTIPLMLEKTSQMDEMLPQIITLSKAAKEKTFAKIIKQVAELKLELEPQRLAQEAALLSTKIDITEEVERLASHLQTLRNLLTSNNSTLGKPLEFLLQELGREINTIASKTSTNEITTITLAVKMTLEKIREQALNLQ